MAADEKPAWTRHLITFLLVFGLGGFIMLSGRGGCGQRAPSVRPADVRIVPVRIDRWTVRAEVADTQELRRKGLSGRAVIEPGYGMLFVYEEPSILAFWMKDTTIPLSIAFIKEDGTIVQIERMQPQDLTRILSGEAVKYALEVRQGWFEERSIKPGVKAEIPEDQLRAAPAAAEGPEGAGEPDAATPAEPSLGAVPGGEAESEAPEATPTGEPAASDAEPEPKEAD